MTRAFLSSDWYRVAGLRPRLRGHVEVFRQHFRGQLWYIVQDAHSGKYHRITPTANHLIALMNGRRTMQEIWEATCRRFEQDPPTQSETIRLLSQLHSADLIASDLAPDLEEIGRRHAKQDRQAMLARIRNPMALRLPLFDPDAFLTATVGAVRWLFTPFGFVLWLALILTGLVFLGLEWERLTEGFSDQVLAAENLLLLALAYPVVKALHELGHGYATKVWGGEVHEIGVMFLVFIPVPYVDASASTAFASKWRRAVVGGAGIMVELAVSAAALIFWVYAEPGLARAFAFNIMLIGGVSTLLFNGNPLLRFDGYFVFADLLEMPNLGQRSNKYFFYLVRRYLFRVKDAESPVTARGEKTWFVCYSVAAFAYRIFISFAIALFVASKFFAIGVLLACWALYNTFVSPLFKGIKYLFTAPELRDRRGRVLGLTGGAIMAALAVLFVLPAPLTTVRPGVVWVDQASILRARTEGFVTEVASTPTVSSDTPVITLDDPALDSRIEVLESRLDEYGRRLRSLELADQVQARMLRGSIRLLQDQLSNLEERRENLVTVAQTDGALVVPEAADLPGRLVGKGALMGYLLSDSAMTLRVAVPQARVDLVRNRTGAVEIMFEDSLGQEIPAHLLREVPQSQNLLPSHALSTLGGGDIVLDPAGQTGFETIGSVFQFEIAPDTALPVTRIGARAMVKFDHGTEPVGLRVYRAARQLFLGQFRV